MIKLNNKNITYVALADTNNSLKAPKEVWYADSNNSVKLVYRRKDALIEGEDYEKYHWLVATIPVGVLMMNLSLNTNDFYFKRKWHIFGNVGYFSTDSHAYFTHYSNRKVAVYDKSTGDSVVYGSGIDPDIEVIIDSNSSRTLINNIDVPMYDDTATSILFQNAANGQNTSELSTSAITVDGSVRYTPCKLLKPVPKWLDANGIRRQVGECGMIDLVSGKFYGNVNSVGTFTVENYYERKEWLVANIYETTGENPMCDLPINSDTFEFRIIMQSENPLNIGHIKNPNYWYFSYTLTDIKVWNIENRTIDFTSNIGSNDMTFKSTSSEFTINNIQVTKYGFPAKYKTFFNNRTNGDAIVCNSSIFVDNTERYIPCTLTMDLPASMDANNTARTKGTSGMWDLVSDKFYGNVASSGTFKAVNLAEGVDYEVHQWLRAEMPLKKSLMALPINSNNVDYYIKRLSLGNITILITNGYKYFFWNNAYEIGSYGNGTDVEHYSYSSDTQLFHIVTNSTDVLINNITYNSCGFPIQTVNFITEPAGNAGITLTSSITVDGVERYIPVKLLKSIPSKYDANGIARQAGECGMYDTVNDVFYGNVASSGTFSVSDDS